MLKTILVPLDGSALADRALPVALALAARQDCRIVLVRAALAHTLPGVDPTEAQGRAIAEAEDHLAVVAGPLTAQEHPVETTVPYGEPADAILHEIRIRRPDLVVMASHGRSGLGRWVYGSVADAVLRRAEVPVLLVPAAGEQPWPTNRAPRILVPLDGSDLAAEALGPASELARQLAAELVLVSVIQPPTYAYAEGYDYVLLDQDEERAAVASDLEAIAERLRGDGLTASVRTVVGFAATMIAEIGREERIDLIVMATHGRGGLARLVLGSVATGTLQRAGLPVLLVRPAAVHRPSAEPAGPPPTASPAVPEPVVPAIDLRLTASELDLLGRGLGELLFAPEADRRLGESARGLLARVRQAEQELSAGADQAAAVPSLGPGSTASSSGP
jgi:nucleotide-binding universal stress UspA family protein